MWLTFLVRSPFADHESRSARGTRRRSTISTDATAPSVSRVRTSFRTEFFIAHDVRLTRWHEALIAAALDIPSTSEDRSSMYLPARAFSRLALTIGLFWYADAHAGSRPRDARRRSVIRRSSSRRPLERVTRRRRRIRGAKVRALLSRALGVMRGAATRIDAANMRLQTRRAPHDVLARGPPRSPDL